MKLDLVKEEMSMLLENLSEQFEMINKHENTIPQIELDIFMRNIQKLYENSIYLNKVNHSEPHFDLNNDTEVQTDNHISKKEQKEDLIIESAAVEDKTENIKITEEIPNKENPNSSTSEIKEDIANEKEEENNLETETQVVAETQAKQEFEPKTIEPTINFDDLLDEDSEQESDLFSNLNTSSEIVDINHKLAEARNTQSIVEKLQNKRIESLKTVIGINDKFYFINELFSGDSQKYEDIIYTLNNFKKLEDAMVYFSTLKYKFGWDEEAEAYGRLIQMLERKFEMVNA